MDLNQHRVFKVLEFTQYAFEGSIYARIASKKGCRRLFLRSLAVSGQAGGHALDTKEITLVSFLVLN